MATPRLFLMYLIISQYVILNLYYMEYNLRTEYSKIIFKCYRA